MCNMKDGLSNDKRAWVDEFNGCLRKPFYLGLSKFFNQIHRQPTEKVAHFWSNWIPSVFRMNCLTQLQKLKVVYTYFTGQHLSEKLVEFLVAKEPELLADAARLSKLCYREEHWKLATRAVNEKSNRLNRDFDFMMRLKEMDELLYNQALESQKNLSGKEFGVHLGICAAWLEDRSHHLISIDDGILMNSLGLFIESYVKSKRIKCNDVALIRHQISEVTTTDFEVDCRDLVLKSLDAWLDWYRFKITLWDTFFFDLNFSVEKDNVTLSAQNVQDYLNWKEKGGCYWELDEYYREISETYAVEVADILAKKGLPKDEMATQVAAMHMYSVDLNVHLLEEPKILDLVWALARERHLDSTHVSRIQLEIKKGLNTTVVHRKLFELDSRIVPVKIRTKLESLEWTRQFLPDDEEEPDLVSEQTMDRISTEVNSKGKFDRHRPEIDLHAFPIIKIGETYIQFPGVSGRQIAVHSISEMTLGKDFGSGKLGKQSATELEVRLATLFANLTSSKPLLGSEFWSEKDKEKNGDVDFAWLFENRLYVFQLKRGKLKLKPEDVVKERFGSVMIATEQISIAANQLPEFSNEVSAYIDKDLLELEIVPVVIHNSFEASYEKIDGISVLNFFDVIRMLENHLTTAELMDKWLRAKIHSPWLVSEEDLAEYTEDELKIQVGFPRP